MRLELATSAKRWLEALAGLFYPEACQCCGKERALPEEGYVCRDCRGTIRLVSPPYCDRCGLPFEGDITTTFQCANCHDVPLHFSYARSAAAARGVVRDVIHKFKYEKARWFEPFLTGLLVEAAVPVLKQENWNVVMPVPLYPLRQREREFNQAEVLARALAAALGLPVEKRVLLRIKETDTQTRLSREERARNVRDAFATRKGRHLKGARVVLVDDVLTTGATTSACARTLRKAGAEEVCVWTVARGLIH